MFFVVLRKIWGSHGKVWRAGFRITKQFFYWTQCTSRENSHNIHIGYLGTQKTVDVNHHLWVLNPPATDVVTSASHGSRASIAA